MGTPMTPGNHCRRCGQALTRRFCSRCGTDSACSSCGSTLIGSFCGECGTPSGAGLQPQALTSESRRRVWPIPTSIAAALLLIFGVITYVASSDRATSSTVTTSDSIGGGQVNAPTESTSTTAPPTSTTSPAPPTSVAVNCPVDDASLKAAIVKSGAMNGPTMSHMGVVAGSARYAIGTKYILFRLTAIDELGAQGGGMFMRCDAGTWKFINFVVGYSCDPTWVGEDRAAAVTFQICE